MSALETGQIAPDFHLRMAGGGEFSLAELLTDRPALLAFYKVTCPTCQLTLPYLQRLQDSSIRVVAVAQDDAGRVAEFNQAFDVDLPTLLDPPDRDYPASKAYGLTHVPSMFLVEQDRSISWSWVGFHKRKLEELAKRAGRPIFGPDDRVPETKPG